MQIAIDDRRVLATAQFDHVGGHRFDESQHIVHRVGPSQLVAVSVQFALRFLEHLEEGATSVWDDLFRGHIIGNIFDVVGDDVHISVDEGELFGLHALHMAQPF